MNDFRKLFKGNNHGGSNISQYGTPEERGQMDNALEKSASSKAVFTKGFYSVPNEKDDVFTQKFMDDEEPILHGELKSTTIKKGEGKTLEPGDRYITNTEQTARVFLDKNGNIAMSSYQDAWKIFGYTAEGIPFIKDNVFETKKTSVYMDKTTNKLHLFSSDAQLNQDGSVDEVLRNEIVLDHNNDKIEIIKRDAGNNVVGKIEMLSDGTINLN